MTFAWLALEGPLTGVGLDAAILDMPSISASYPVHHQSEIRSTATTSCAPYLSSRDCLGPREMFHAVFTKSISSSKDFFWPWKSRVSDMPSAAAPMHAMYCLAMTHLTPLERQMPIKRCGSAE